MTEIVKVTFNTSSLSDDEDMVGGPMEIMVEEGGSGGEDTYILEKLPENNLWSVKDNALRDLLIFLVQKYRIDEVYDSKLKAKNWDFLIEEFHHMTENKVTISKPQIIRKWHNWKQYNKARKKPHPFVVCGNIAVETVIEKCTQLCQQARVDPELAGLLARGPIEAIDPRGDRKRSLSESDNPIEEIVANKYNNGHLGRILRRDFIVRKTGANAAALTLKRLHHEIALEGLNYEQEKWRIKVENSRILNEKLQRQLELIQIRLQRAQTDLVIKKNQCLNIGIDVEASMS